MRAIFSYMRACMVIPPSLLCSQGIGTSAQGFANAILFCAFTFVRSCWGLLGVASEGSVPVFACTWPHLTHLLLRRVQITERTPVMIPQVSWSMQTRLKNRYCITQPVDQAILTHVRAIQPLDPGPMALWTSMHYHPLVYIQACTLDYILRHCYCVLYSIMLRVCVFMLVCAVFVQYLVKCVCSGLCQLASQEIGFHI